jgi:hypothetical protein
LLDKARRAENCGNAALGDYLFGERDYLDGKLLEFLGLRESEIRRIVRTAADDEDVAQLVLQAAQKNPEECAAFSKRFARRYGIFLAMLDADEGREKPSLLTKFMQVTYNRLIYPIARVMYNLRS